MRARTGSDNRPQEAVTYIRVSSKEQQEEGYSLEAQEQLLRGYASRNGFAIVREFKDVETAKRAGRPSFSEMVLFLRRHVRHRPAILVEKTDRLYRNLKDWVTLDELEVEIHFVKENFVLSRESRSNEKFVHGIKVLMAKNYIDNLAEETEKGMLEKARQGYWPSTAPIGYANVERDKQRLIEPDPEKAPLVHRLFELYATGNYSLDDLRHKIAREGLAYGARRSPMPKSSLEHILKNPIYYGDFAWKGVMYHGQHEPIVSRGLWEAAQAVFGNKWKSKSKKHEFAFTGLIECGTCGCAITAEIKKGKYVYYHCTQYKQKCPGPYLREEVLAAMLGELLKPIQIPPQVAAWLESALRESHADEKAFHEEAVHKLQAEYNRLQRRLDSMYVDKLDGQITAEFYAEKSQEWRGQQDAILAQIQQHQSADRSYVDTGVAILQLAEKAHDLYVGQPPHEQRKLLNFVLSNCKLLDGKLIPTYRKPFDILAAYGEEARKNLTGEGASRAKMRKLPGLVAQSSLYWDFAPHMFILPKLETGPREPRMYRNPLFVAREWAGLIESGQVRNAAHLAHELGLSRARVTQVLNLLKLPADTVESLATLGEWVTVGNVGMAHIRRVSADLGRREYGGTLTSCAGTVGPRAA
jgi:site-specific DNA recombinase